MASLTRCLIFFFKVIVGKRSKNHESQKMEDFTSELYTFAKTASLSAFAYVLDVHTNDQSDVKPPKSAWEIYRNDFFPNLPPNLSPLQKAEIMKSLWENLIDEMRELYKQKAKADLQRYIEEMKEDE